MFLKIGVLLIISSFALAKTDSQMLNHWTPWLGRSAINAGPNCWNVVMAEIGEAKALRFTGPDEFRRTLDMYCQERPSISKIQVGDVAAITTSYQSELHGFILVDSLRGLTKDYGSDDPALDISYRVEPISKIVSSYWKDPKSAECINGLADSEQSPCGSEIKYYACDRKKIINDQKMIQKKWPVLFKHLNELEIAMQMYHFGQKNSDEILIPLNFILLDLKELKIEQQSSFKKLLVIRMNGIADALYEIKSKRPELRTLQSQLLNLIKKIQ